MTMINDLWCRRYDENDCNGRLWQSRSSKRSVCLPWKVIFHWRSSSIETRLPSKVIFHRRLSSIKGCLPSKIVSHQGPSLTDANCHSKICQNNTFHGAIFVHIWNNSTAAALILTKLLGTNFLLALIFFDRDFSTKISFDLNFFEP